MPLLSITTNQTIPEAERPDTLKRLSAAVAEMLGKPEQYVMVSYQHNPDMLFAGTAEPLAYLELKSIGLPRERTKGLSSALAEQLEAILGIAANRMYIEFSSADRDLFGWNGTTFAN